MKLYHGTWEGNEDDIINDGLIKCNASSCYSEDTEFINSIFEENLGYNLRGSCIYLTCDKDATHGFDYAFGVNIKSLNKNLLYVGSNQIVQDIFYEAMREAPSKDIIKRLVLEYENTFISFDEYLRTEKDLDHTLEFLYFGDIRVTEADLLQEELLWKCW